VFAKVTLSADEMENKTNYKSLSSPRIFVIPRIHTDPFSTRRVVKCRNRCFSVGLTVNPTSYWKLLARARQLRYVTELGFDVYSRFYQLPVTCT